MAEIRWTMTAAKDLEAIEGFVARDSPLYAVRLVDGIVRSVDRLDPFPLSGRTVPEFERQELREVIYRSYRVVYLLRDEVVWIVRVVHGARDLARLAEHEGWDLSD
jgi:toxin ParE1/3/4